MSAAPAGRVFGKTGLAVPELGFGAGVAGDPSLSEWKAEALLHSVLDLGVGLLDTARSGAFSTGISLHRGRRLRRRRVDECPAW